MGRTTGCLSGALWWGRFDTLTGSSGTFDCNFLSAHSRIFLSSFSVSSSALSVVVVFHYICVVFVIVGLASILCFVVAISSFSVACFLSALGFSFSFNFNAALFPYLIVVVFIVIVALLLRKAGEEEEEAESGETLLLIPTFLL